VRVSVGRRRAATGGQLENARSELAAGVGCRRLVEMQEEILRLRGAASIPVALATQVLGEFVKTGMPTHTEAMDADMAEARFFPGRIVKR